MARAAAPLRAVGAVRIAPHRGARREGRRRDALRDRRLDDARDGSRPSSPAATRRIRTSTRRSVECLHIAHAFERADEFDLIHNSFDFLPLTYSGLVDTPVLTTIHGFSSERILPVYQRYNATGRLRRDQRRRPASEPRLPRHDPSRHRHRARSRCTRRRGGYLLFFGRIHPDKGTAEAIDVADASGLPLVIAGIVQDQEYFDERVAPRLDGERVAFVGPVERGRAVGSSSAARTRCCT